MTSAAMPETSAPVNLLAGGHWHSGRSPDPLLQTCLKQTVIDSPSIAYIGAASGDDPDFFRRLSSAFRNAGAGAVTLVPLAAGTPDTKTACRILTNADLIFISGGDVKAGMDCLRASKLLPFLHRLHSQGKPFLGLSAGSIMLAQHWIHWADADDDSTAEPFQCMGVAPVLCDTHAEEDNWQELHTLLRLLPEGIVGYGIPAGGGLRLTGTGITALGQPLQRFRRTGSRISQLTPITP